MTANRNLLLGVAVTALIAGFGGYGLARWSPPEPMMEAAKAEPAEHAADALTLSTDAIRGAGIVVEPVAAGGLSGEILAQAIVAASPTGQAVLTARAAGAVTQIYKRLGDPVRAGEALALVESRDAAQLAADRSAAAARAAQAARNLAREKSLYDQRVSPRADYENAQAEAATAQAEATRAANAASAAGVAANGRGVIVASPIAGRVTAAPAVLGAFVQPETELFRVADSRRIQIEAAIGNVDAQRVAAGDRAVIEAGDGVTVAGKVRAVTPTLDAETRQATAVIEPIGGSFRPGQSLRVRILPRTAAISEGIVVPEDAVQSIDGRDMAFVRTPTGFVATPVTIGARSGSRVEITSGLKPGQSVATHNAFRLKAELAKGSGDEAEGH